MAKEKGLSRGVLSELYGECRDLQTYVLGLRTTVRRLDESGAMMTYKVADRELTYIHHCLGGILKGMGKHGHGGGSHG